MKHLRPLALLLATLAVAACGGKSQTGGAGKQSASETTDPRLAALESDIYDASLTNTARLRPLTTSYVKRVRKLVSAGTMSASTAKGKLVQVADSIRGYCDKCEADLTKAQNALGGG